MPGYKRWREDDIQSAFHSIENGVSVNKSWHSRAKLEVANEAGFLKRDLYI